MLTHASWNTFYRASLIGIFPAPAVMGSYLNLLIGGWALPLVLIALTRGRLGYREGADAADAPSADAASALLLALIHERRRESVRKVS